MTANLETESFKQLITSETNVSDVTSCDTTETMVVASDVYDALTSLYDTNQSAHLSRFFKTEKGEYGEGDKFLGVKVPQTRNIVKSFCKQATLGDVEILTRSKWHEVRLAGFLLLIEKYTVAKKRKNLQRQNEIAQFYLSIIERGNNWDLVDVVCPYILGDLIDECPEKEPILYTLASHDNLWKKRVAIVSTLTLIRRGKFTATLTLCETLRSHPHDLIHKAIGWMLREVGKKDMVVLEQFLNCHAKDMPRVSLRYAIERLSPEQRRFYMAKPFKPIN